MPDVITVFKDPATNATRERVIDFLFPIYDEYSDISVEKAWSKELISDELFIPMPTVAAYCSEVELCEAILSHTRGELSDIVMSATLREFLDTHIWIYHPDGPRTNKKGRWPDWTRGVSLYHLRFTMPASGLENNRETRVVNAMQSWLVRLCEERRGSTDFSLHRI